jgi:methionyl-tRNA formyltransferase
MRIIFFGGGDWAASTLRALAGDGHDLAGVVAARERAEDLLAAAWALGVDARQPARAGAELLAHVDALAADLLVSVDYELILGPELLRAAPLGAINAHPGLLPAYRGVGVVTWALQNGEPEVGVTVHHMDEGIDSGDVILQRRLPVAAGDDNGDLVARIDRTLPALVVEAVRLLAAGRAPRVPQDHARATYFAARRPVDDQVRWSAPSVAVHNLVRALARPNPGAATWLDGTPVTIWRTALRPGAPAYRAVPGQVVGNGPDGPIVKTGDTSIVVSETQLAGESTPARPPRWPLGTRLGADPLDLALRLRERVETLERRMDGARPFHQPVHH